MDYSLVIDKIKSSIALIHTEKGSGTGFVFQKQNILVTCNHVVNGCSKIFIKFPDSEFINAERIIRDEEHDLALLKFNDSKIREPLDLITHEKIKEGTSIIFSGYPLGFKTLVTHQGIISAVTKDATGVITYLIDGTVNLGNSGCPLMSVDGEVIGIVNAMKIERNDLLDKVNNMELGAVALHNTDLVDIFKAVIRNLQLGIGYAVPASYIPEHKVINGDKENGDKN